MPSCLFTDLALCEQALQKTPDVVDCAPQSVLPCCHGGSHLIQLNPNKPLLPQVASAWYFVIETRKETSTENQYHCS